MVIVMGFNNLLIENTPNNFFYLIFKILTKFLRKIGNTK